MGHTGHVNCQGMAELVSMVCVLASMVSSVRAGHAGQVHSRVVASKVALISVCLDVVGVQYHRGL